MLAKLGYKAHVARNGQEAVSLYKADSTYDLILMVSAISSSERSL